MMLIISPNFVIIILIKDMRNLIFKNIEHPFLFENNSHILVPVQETWLVNLLSSIMLRNDIFIFTHGNLLTYLCKDRDY
jgi:hypothetical protein